VLRKESFLAMKVIKRGLRAKRLFCRNVFRFLDRRRQQLIIRSAEKFSDTLGTFEYFIAFREIRAAGQIAGRPESLMRRAPSSCSRRRRCRASSEQQTAAAHLQFMQPLLRPLRRPISRNITSVCCIDILIGSKLGYPAIFCWNEIHSNVFHRG
jgi:hypothetical protein